MKKRRSIIAVFFMMIMLAGGTMKTQAAGKYTIYVNRRTNIINVTDQDGHVVRAMYCSTGKRYATIRGTFHTQSRMRWHQLNHGVYGQYCTRIHAGYLFHSVWYYAARKSQLARKEYNKLGSQASAGCVRLAVIDAKWIYDHCRLGTRVVIGESRKLQKPSRKKIKLSSSGRGWDPTDPDPSNPYRPKIRLKKGVSKKIALGSQFDPMAQVTVSSKITKKKELKKHITVAGQVDVNKPGEYKLVYTVTDPRTLLSRKLKVTFKVKEQEGSNDGTTI